MILLKYHCHYPSKHSRIDYHCPKWWRWIIITVVDYYSLLLTATDYYYWSLSCWLLLPFVLFIAVIHHYWLLVSLLSSLMYCIITSIITGIITSIITFFFLEELGCFPISLQVDQDLSLGEELKEVGGWDDSAGRRGPSAEDDSAGSKQWLLSFGV